MRLVSLTIMLLLGFWVVSGMPVPVPGVKPLGPSPEVGTFKDAVRDLSAVQAAVRMGRVEQNSEMRRMREQQLDADQWLKQDPCSSRLKEKFVTAAIPFIEWMYGERRFPEETHMIDGRELNVANEFNRPVEAAIRDAVLEGRVHPRDLPPGLGLIGKIEADEIARRLGGRACGS